MLAVARWLRCITLVLACMLCAPAWSRVAAEAPTVLSRQTTAVSGTLAPGGTANYTVDYEPQTEGLGKPAPWVLRLYFSAPGAAPGSVSFVWFDQTNPTVSGATNGAAGTSAPPQIGGNATNVPPGTDTSVIQQAVLSGGGPGPFSITVINTSTVQANYTLRLYPLNGGALEAGVNPNATPVPTGPGAPAAAPAPPVASSPPAAPAPPAFTPFWVKTVQNGAVLYSGPTSPPAISFGSVPQFTCLQVVEPPVGGARLRVLNPATRDYAYVNSADVGGLTVGDNSCGGLLAGPAPVVAPAPPPAPAFASFWVKTLISGAQLYSNTTSPPAISFGQLRQFACLQVVEAATSGRFRVYNPATRNYAYVNVAEVGGLSPTDRSCG